MSKWNKEELENMLEDVINELDLSEIMIEKHGQEGTAPAKLVKLVLEQKNRQMRLLKANEDKTNNKSGRLIAFITWYANKFEMKFTDEYKAKLVNEFKEQFDQPNCT